MFKEKYFLQKYLLLLLPFLSASAGRTFIYGREVYILFSKVFRSSCIFSTIMFGGDYSICNLQGSRELWSNRVCFVGKSKKDALVHRKKEEIKVRKKEEIKLRKKEEVELVKKSEIELRETSSMELRTKQPLDRVIKEKK